MTALTHGQTANRRTFRSERGLRPRNPLLGEVSEGGEAPLRQETLTLAFALGAMAINLVTDLVYPLFDPRVRIR